MVYFHLVDHRQHHHHTYWTHFPIVWLSLLLFSLIWFYSARTKGSAALAFIFTINGFIHLFLDTIVGDIWWLAPFVDKPFALFTVPALYTPWWLNFFLHWSFALELASVAWAAYLWCNSPNPLFKRDALNMLCAVPFYYLRHGQTDWNLEHRAQGQQDIELNDTGRMQAVRAVSKLRSKGIESVCCSPLARARETASIIASALSLPLVVVDDLKEAAWGVFEGQTKGPWFNHWREGKNHEGAEPYEAFVHRALRGINSALRERASVLIVAHGGTYWAVEKHTRISLKEDIPNCTPVHHCPPMEGQEAWLVEAIS